MPCAGHVCGRTFGRESGWICDPVTGALLYDSGTVRQCAVLGKKRRWGWMMNRSPSFFISMLGFSVDELELGEYSLLVRSHALCSGAVACLNSAGVCCDSIRDDGLGDLTDP